MFKVFNTNNQYSQKKVLIYQYFNTCEILKVLKIPISIPIPIFKIDIYLEVYEFLDGPKSPKLNQTLFYTKKAMEKSLWSIEKENFCFGTQTNEKNIQDLLKIEYFRNNYWSIPILRFRKVLKIVNTNTFQKYWKYQFYWILKVWF